MATNNRAPGSPSRADQTQPGTTAPGTIPQIPSPGFSALDQLVYALDGAYDQLSNQAAWDTYAASMFGAWALCANCQPSFAGKKIFRQINFNRRLLGLPLQTVPGSSPIHVFGDVTPVGIFGMPPGNQVSPFFSSGPMAISLLIPRVGQALGNPSLTFDPAWYGVSSMAGDPFYDWLYATLAFAGFLPLALGDSVSIPICTADLQGNPGPGFDMQVNQG